MNSSVSRPRFGQIANAFGEDPSLNAWPSCVGAFGSSELLIVMLLKFVAPVMFGHMLALLCMVALSVVQSLSNV